MRSAGAGSAGTDGERWCTGRERGSSGEREHTLTTLKSEVSDVAEVMMSKSDFDVVDVKSADPMTRAMERAAPGISL